MVKGLPYTVDCRHSKNTHVHPDMCMCTCMCVWVLLCGVTTKVLRKIPRNRIREDWPLKRNRWGGRSAIGERWKCKSVSVTGRTERKYFSKSFFLWYLCHYLHSPLDPPFASLSQRRKLPNTVMLLTSTLFPMQCLCHTKKGVWGQGFVTEDISALHSASMFFVFFRGQKQRKSQTKKVSYLAI